jgi:hypothetical protein
MPSARGNIRAHAGRILVILAAVALLAAEFATVVDAENWEIQVSISPPQTKADRNVDFILTLHNADPTATVTVCQIDIKYDWDTDFQNVFTGSKDITPTNSEPFPAPPEAIPDLAPATHSATVAVKAKRLLDLECSASSWIVSIEVVANVAPTAAFSYSPRTPAPERVVYFTDESTDDERVVAWRWDFGDGVTSNIRNPTYAFLTAGNHTVVLEVTDGDGSTDTESHTVQVAAASGGNDPRPSGFGVLEWGAIGTILASISVFALLMAWRRTRPSPRRWGQAGNSQKPETKSRWRPR